MYADERTKVELIRRGATAYPSLLMPDRVCFFEFLDAVPEIIYRYTSNNNAKDWIENGKVRLGTLFGYRKKELNFAQRDIGEGGIVTNGKLPNGDLVQWHVSSQDCWTMCFSTALDSRLVNEFEAEAIIAVETRKFCAALSKAIALRSHIGGIMRVKYMSENDLSLASEHIFARKIKRSEGYSHQAEIRICFESRDDIDYWEFINSDFVQDIIQTGTDWRQGAAPQFGVSHEFVERSLALLSPIFITSRELSDCAKLIEVKER